MKIKERVHHKSSNKLKDESNLTKIFLRNDGQTRENSIRSRNNHGHAINEKKRSDNEIKDTSYVLDEVEVY